MGWGKVRKDITGTFGVLPDDQKWKERVDFFAERGLCMGNMYFKHNYIHKYTRMAKGRDGMEAKNVTDLVFVKRYTKI